MSYGVRSWGLRGSSSKSGLDLTEIEPSSGCSEDAKNYILLVQLPGCKPDEVKYEVDVSGFITITGTKYEQGGIKRYKKKLKLPETTDIYNMDSSFEGNVLCISFRKLVAQESKQVLENPNENHDKISDLDGDKEDKGSGENEKSGVRDIDSYKEEIVEKPEHEIIQQGRFTGFLEEHKSMFLTNVLAFSLGVLVSQLFKLNRQ